MIIRQSSLDDPMYVNTGPGVDPGCPSAQLRSGSPLRPSNESGTEFDERLFITNLVYFWGEIEEEIL